MCLGKLTSFGVQEIDDRKEEGVCNRPDDPESPAKVLNANRGDFNNDKVCHPEQVNHRPFKDASLTCQFVPVARAAPLVLIGRELISVGYSHGTPNIPIPKDMKKRKKKAIEAEA